MPVIHESSRVQEADVLFPLFMDYLPGGAWVKDRAGHYVYANRYASERIFRRPLAEILGRTDHEILPAGVAAQFRANDVQVVSTGERLETIETLPRDGLARHSIIHKFPIREALAEVERLKLRVERENIYLREEIRTEHDFAGIVGESPALRRVLADVDRVAATHVTVLITGETGTGKELIARAIHSRSARADRPLIKVSCGALSPGVVESELFGHEKGAFTGALLGRAGRFELANGGTIFLAEVGELAPETQVKLLNVLQEGEYERVGSNRTRKVDCRVIAATNRNLQDAVATGRFRADLYYRLSIFPIVMPPLRKRASDIPLLAEYFLAKSAERLGRSYEGLSKLAMERLTAYAWPGNVRELQNVVERAAVLATGPVVEVADAALAPASLGECDTLEGVERAHIQAVLERTGWRLQGTGGAAGILDMHPSTLRSRMQKLGIRKPGGKMNEGRHETTAKTGEARARV